LGSISRRALIAFFGLAVRLFGSSVSLICMCVCKDIYILDGLNIKWFICHSQRSRI
jgi:hypothetical protein